MGKQPGMVHGPRGERHGPGELAMANGKQQLLLEQVEIREALQPREHLNPAGLTGPRASPQLRENSFTAQPQQRLGPAQADLGQISTDLAGKGWVASTTTWHGSPIASARSKAAAMAAADPIAPSAGSRRGWGA